MPKKVSQPQIVTSLHTLRETPLRLAAWTAGMDETRLRAAPEPNEWSMVEILAHIRAAAEVWSYSIYAMLTLESPALAHVHPRDWMKTLGYARLSFAENLGAFRVERENLLRVLGGLSPADWDRSASFTGKKNSTTIFGEMLRMALHEADHWAQFEKTAAAVQGSSSVQPEPQ